MKKKFFSVVLVASMVASLAGCGASKSSTETTAATTASTMNKEMSADDYAASIATNADIYKQYITLPTYTGIQVTVDRSSLNITDDAVDTSVASTLTSYATTDTITSGATVDGDTVTLDYSGYLDGTAFSGGTATDASYTIGSYKFINDLDRGLIGLNVGQEYDIPCTFPSDYSSSDLAGKNVIFKVTVSAIQRKTSPTLTDQWVVDNASSLGTDATTVDGYKAFVKQNLETQAESSVASSKYESIWNDVSAAITVNGYPQDELDKLVSTLKSNVQSEFNQYGSAYGITDFDTYLSSVYGFSTEDDFNNYAVQYAQKYLLEKMAITMIAEEQNISVSADEINDMGNKLASYYGYTDYAEILSTYGNEMNAEVGYEVLYQKVQTFLNDNAVEV
jgi:trigger factor